MVVLACLSTSTSAQEAAHPLDARGYIGIITRQLDQDRVVVTRVLPGPLDSMQTDGPSVGDLLVSIDQQPVRAEDVQPWIRRLEPGTEVQIGWRRRISRSPLHRLDAEHEPKTRFIDVVLADAADWTGTIGLGSHQAARHAVLKPIRDLDPDDPESLLAGAIREAELEEPLRVLIDLFGREGRLQPDLHRSRLVSTCMDSPFLLPAVQAWIDGPLHREEQPITTRLAHLLSRAVDVPWEPGQSHGRMLVDRAQGGIFYLVFLLSEMWVMHNEATGNISEDLAMAQKCIDFLQQPETDLVIGGGNAAELIEVIDRSRRFDPAGIIPMLKHMDIGLNIKVDMSTLEPEEIPFELKNSITGDVLATQYFEPIGWLVVGSTGDNTYDMSRIAGVFDPGGDDRYEATGLCIGMRGIVDLDGDDHYPMSSMQGPAAGLMGASFIDDRSGDDVYGTEGGRFGCGAAIYGLGILMDHQGNDTYHGTGFSSGSACWGMGALVDMGHGDDLYDGGFLCQGVGGPGGLGILLDEGGDDRYVADGAVASLYGNDGVHASMSQGFGFGYRYMAAGGTGMLVDREGDDRYTAGEFAQGGAYYQSLGVLHDGGGDDRYDAAHWGQGFGVYQAFGILVDDSGDDRYTVDTIAAQGFGWDMGAGMLLDHGGDDHYTADDLAQGCGSQQGIGACLDRGGTNTFTSERSHAQGCSGANAYHYPATGAFSFSVLELLEGISTCSLDRPDSGILSTGRFDVDSPGSSTLHGVFINHPLQANPGTGSSR